MKNYTILATVVMAIIGVGGIIGTTSGFSFTSPTSSQGNSPAEQSAFEGHVTVIAKHSDGTVYAYRQSDNTVTQVGKTCAGVALFGSNGTGGTAQCGGAGTNKFQYISVGDSGAALSDGFTFLNSEVQRQIQNGGIGTTNATAGGKAVSDVVATITMTNATGGKTLQESGLHDGSGTHASSHMFSRLLISPTIAVNNNDQVTVRWTISLG